MDVMAAPGTTTADYMADLVDRRDTTVHGSVVASADRLLQRTSWDIADPIESAVLISDHSDEGVPLTNADWDIVAIAGKGIVYIYVETFGWAYTQADRLAVQAPCTLRGLLTAVSKIYREPVSRDVLLQHRESNLLAAYYVEVALDLLAQGQVARRAHLLGGPRYFEGLERNYHNRPCNVRLRLGS